MELLLKWYTLMAIRAFDKAHPIRFPIMDSSSEIGGLRDLDPQAVSLIYSQYFPEVYRYVRFRLGDELLSEDVTSEVFLRLLKAVRERRGPRKNLHGWLISTAHHKVMDALRQKYRHPHETLTELISFDGHGPLEEVERRDTSAAMRKALLRLTGKQQHVLALRFGEGCSLEETAALMNKNVNAVKALQFRALSALQRILDA